jgi:D-xylose transport system substrate-binding protein
MRPVVAAAGCALVLVASACGSASNTAATGTATNTAKPKVGVILPDTTTSARWEDSDKPLLTSQLSLASGASVIEIEGASTDNNATQFHDGHEQVLKPLYDSGSMHLLASKSIDNWSPDLAASTFTSLLDANGGHVDAVLSANDGMAASIEAVLKQRNLTNVPVTGQDATLGGLQAVLRGTQCMTVYKPIDIEAEAASRLAIALATGRQGDADDLATGNTQDPKANRDVKSVLLGPQSISRADVQGLVAKGVVRTADLCKGDMAGFCTSAGIPVQ